MTDKEVTATIIRTGPDAYTVLFDGMRSEGVTRAQLTRREFPDLPDIPIGHKVVARWVPMATYSAKNAVGEPLNFDLNGTCEHCGAPPSTDCRSDYRCQWADDAHDLSCSGCEECRPRIPSAKYD